MRKISIFIFSLFSLFAHSQDRQKEDSFIILNRLYEEPDDGACNLFLDKYFFSSKKIKCSPSIIDDFKKIKKRSSSWKKGREGCFEKCIGCLRIENQLILKSKNYLDTIYFNINEYERVIIDGNSYIDSKNEIYKIISKNKELKDFFDAPIRGYYREIFDYPSDSLSVNEFKIGNQIVYNKNLRELDSIIRFESIIYTETEDRRFHNDKIETDKNYECWQTNNNSYNKYYFDKNGIIQKIKIDEIEKYNQLDKFGYFEIFALKIGDNEQKLIEKFPNSCKYISHLREYFRNINDNTYAVEVNFIDQKGFVVFYLKDGFITSIEVTFDY